MRIRHVVYGICLVTLLSLMITACGSSGDAVRTSVRSDAEQIVSDIKAAEKRDPSIGFSSNPYDYADLSPAMQRLVDRGPGALNAIADEVEASSDNGLREYLLAIAGARIQHDESHAWQTGKEWAALYRQQR